MILAVVLTVVGLVLLSVGAGQLVSGASRLAIRLRVRPVVVGVIVIGLGTSVPEFLVSGVAAARGDTGLAVGNIVGSNILNLTLILGIAAVIGTIEVSSTVIRREVRLTVAAVAVFGLVAWLFGLGIWSAALLTTATVAAVALLLRWAGQGRNQALADATTPTVAAPPLVTVAATPPALWVELVRALVGLAGVLAGAELLVVNAASIATRLGASEVVIGFTLVALGTSVPELVTTIVAQRRGESDLVVGNLLGSNLFNSLAGGAVIGFATPAGTPQRSEAVLLVAMIFTTGVAGLLLRRGQRLTRMEGAVLLGLYAATLPLLVTA